MERENTALKSEMSQLRAAWEHEKQELLSELDDLREENQRCLDTLIKHSKTTAQNALAKTHETTLTVMETQRYAQQGNNTTSAKVASLGNIAGRALTLKQLDRKSVV